MHRKQRKRRQRLHQRRMLRIHPEIPLRKRHVSGVEMIVFIPRERLLPDRQRDFKHQDQQKYNQSHHPRTFTQWPIEHISPFGQARAIGENCSRPFRL